MCLSAKRPSPKPAPAPSGGGGGGGAASAPPPPPPPAVAAPTAPITNITDDSTMARRRDARYLMQGRGRVSLRTDATQPGANMGSGLNIPV